LGEIVYILTLIANRLVRKNNKKFMIFQEKISICEKIIDLKNMIHTF